MARICTVLVVAIAAAVISVAGQTPPQKASFEVASIKANTTPGAGIRGGCRGIDTKLNGDMLSGIPVPVGRCVVTAASLSHFISIAYELGVPGRVVDRPDWHDSIRFDLEAKAEDPSKATRQDLVIMLQNLLADRFKLKFHFEARPTDGYALVVAKNGLLKPAKGIDPDGISTVPAPVPDVPGIRKTSARNVTMSTFAAFLTNPVRGVVIDSTGLTGSYDFEFLWGPEVTPSVTPDARSDYSIFTVIQQLGLKIEGSKKVPLEYFVIDHAEKPTGN